MKIQLNKTFLANELSKSLSLKIEGDINQKFNSISNIDDTENGSLKFTKKTSNEYLKGVIIGPSGTKAETLIISDNPRLDFCKALNYFINNNELIFTSRESSIHSSSYIAKTAIIEEGVHIGANSVIEHNVVIHKIQQLEEIVLLDQTVLLVLKDLVLSKILMESGYDSHT